MITYDSEELERAGELCAAVASLMSAAARLPYGGQSARGIEELDSKLSTEDVPNPVKFSHESSGSYLLAAGDFVYGVRCVLDPQIDLHFSSASLSRSACEYAAISWKLSQASLGARNRVALAFATMRADMNHHGNAGQYGELGDDLIARTERWVSQQNFRIPKGFEKTGPLQENMFPGVGDRQYRDLSSKAHPRFTVMIGGIKRAQNILPGTRVEMWQEVLIATSRGLRASRQLADLRGGEVANLDDIIELHSYYASQLDLESLVLTS